MIKVSVAAIAAYLKGRSVSHTGPAQLEGKHLFPEVENFEPRLDVNDLIKRSGLVQMFTVVDIEQNLSHLIVNTPLLEKGIYETRPPKAKNSGYYCKVTALKTNYSFNEPSPAALIIETGFIIYSSVSGREWSRGRKSLKRVTLSWEAVFGMARALNEANAVLENTGKAPHMPKGEEFGSCPVFLEIPLEDLELSI